MTDKQLVNLLASAGFRGKQLQTAYGIAKRESGGDPKAYNPNRSTGDDSYGLFQINMLGDLGPARRKQFGLSSNDDLYDPLTNAKAAFRMSQGGKDFGAWGIGPNAYREGAGFDTIKKYVDTAPVGPGVRPTRKPPVFKLPEFDISKSLSPQGKFPGIKSSGLIDEPPGYESLIDNPPGWKEQTGLLDPLPPIIAEKRARAYGGTTADAGPPQTANPKLAKAIEIAKAQIGVPYVFGAANPKAGFDCSGLIEYAFEQAGIATPGRLSTGPMSHMGQEVGFKNIQPGDWIVRHSGGEGHVVMYVGNGQVIAAPHTGEVVQFQPLARFQDGRYSVRRWHG